MNKEIAGGIRPSVLILSCVTVGAALLLPRVAMTQDGVVVDTIQINLVDRENEPVQNAEVWCIKEHFGTFGGEINAEDIGVSGVDGAVFFQRPTGASYYIYAHKGRIGGWGNATPGTEWVNVDIKLDVHRSLSAQVLDLHGRPVTGAAVIVADTIPFTTTDDDGRFTIPHYSAVAFGRLISVFKEGYAWRSAIPDEPFTDPWFITLEPGRNIAIRAVDGQHELLPSASFSFSWGAIGAGSGGIVRPAQLSMWLPLGRRVQISAIYQEGEGATSAFKNIVVTPDTPDTINLKLPPLPPAEIPETPNIAIRSDDANEPDILTQPREDNYVEGHVVDQHGLPVSNARIRLAYQITKWIPVTDDDGWFRVSYFDDGPDTFTITCPDGAINETPPFPSEPACTIEEGGELTLKLGQPIKDHLIRVHRKPNLFVAGVVVAPDGAMIEHLIGQYYGPDESGSLFTQYGSFALSRFSTSPILLEISSPGYRPAVLVSGRDFEIGKGIIRVELVPGPFSDGEDVFKAVTRLDAPPQGLFDESQWASFQEQAGVWKRRAAEEIPNWFFQVGRILRHILLSVP